MTIQILILIGDASELLEIFVPYSTLTMFGCDVHIISPGRGEGDFVKTVLHYLSKEDWDLALKGKSVTYSESSGHPYRLTHKFKWKNVEEEVENYDGLILPGGRAPEYLSQIPEVHKIVLHFMKSNKPIGAICHGIQILTHADAANHEVEYLKNKKVYPYPSLNLECKLLGAIIEDRYPLNIAYTDGNLVTGPSWQALPEFMKHFLKLLDLKSL